MTLRHGLTPLLRIGACNHFEALARGGMEADGMFIRSGSASGAETHGVRDGLAAGAEKAAGE